MEHFYASKIYKLFQKYFIWMSASTQGGTTFDRFLSMDYLIEIMIIQSDVWIILEQFFFLFPSTIDLGAWLKIMIKICLIRCGLNSPVFRLIGESPPELVTFFLVVRLFFEAAFTAVLWGVCSAGSSKNFWAPWDHWNLGILASISGIQPRKSHEERCLVKMKSFDSFFSHFWLSWVGMRVWCYHAHSMKVLSCWFQRELK